MKQPRKFLVDILFVMILFGLFATSALILVTLGANVYQKTVINMSDNFDSRTATSYITEKIRQNDTMLSGTNSIVITEFSNSPALMLKQQLEEEIYCTYLYLEDGNLMELFVNENLSIGDEIAGAGQPITKLSALSFEQPSENMIIIHITLPDGTQKDLYRSIHGY